MCDYNLSFSSSASLDAASYKLLELPSELVTIVESAIKERATPNLKIKGVHGEDAVLCTANKTYSMRSVVLSNSVLIVTPASTSGTDVDVNDADTVTIRDTLSEVIELAPIVPKLYKLTGLLRGREYDESNVDEDIHSTAGTGRVDGKKWLTYDDAMAEIQASDEELERGLKERRILVVNGCLRPISRSFLTTILELLLNLLVSLSLSPSRASISDLSSTLADEHEIPFAVTHQIMGWFGETTFREDRWVVDLKAVVAEVGLGLLRGYGQEGVQEDVFVSKWRAAVGDSFEANVSTKVISGNYLSSPPPFSADVNPSNILTYFPATSLPVDPPGRFSELFLTRPRWRAEDIAPFLSDIAVDAKDRDRLLLKYARAVTETDGLWYSARAQYS